MILLQDRKPLSRGDGDITVGGLQDTGENLKEGGLACTVGADQSIAVALGELDIDVLEEGLLPTRNVTLFACIILKPHIFFVLPFLFTHIIIHENIVFSRKITRVIKCPLFANKMQYM